MILILIFSQTWYYHTAATGSSTSTMQAMFLDDFIYWRNTLLLSFRCRPRSRPRFSQPAVSHWEKAWGRPYSVLEVSQLSLSWYIDFSSDNSWPLLSWLLVVNSHLSIDYITVKRASFGWPRRCFHFAARPAVDCATATTATLLIVIE